jgi:hypothetical protein
MGSSRMQMVVADTMTSKKRRCGQASEMPKQNEDR